MPYLQRCAKIVHGLSGNLTSNGNTSLLSFGVINSVLAVPTAAANALVIVAILTTSSLRTPSYLLLTSLAFSDLAIGLFGQPLLSSLIFNFLNDKVSAVCYVLAFKYVITSCVSWASTLTVTAISVDRYLAIRLKMRYKTVVTVTRMRFLVVGLWSLSLVAMVLPIAMNFRKRLTLLYSVSQAICLFIILVFYTMSFRAIKAHCAQTQPQGNQQPNSTANPIDILKYRRFLNTIILLVFLIFISYLPLVALFGIATFVTTAIKSQEIDESLMFLGYPVLAGLTTIMTLSSTLNPVIYMTRMRDIRKSCIQVVRRLFGRQPLN